MTYFFPGHRRMIPPVPYDYYTPNFGWLDPVKWALIKRKQIIETPVKVKRKAEPAKKKKGELL